MTYPRVHERFVSSRYALGEADMCSYLSLYIARGEDGKGTTDSIPAMLDAPSTFRSLVLYATETSEDVVFSLDL